MQAPGLNLVQAVGRAPIAFVDLCTIRTAKYGPVIGLVPTTLAINRYRPAGALDHDKEWLLGSPEQRLASFDGQRFDFRARRSQDWLAENKANAQAEKYEQTRHLFRAYRFLHCEARESAATTARETQRLPKENLRMSFDSNEFRTVMGHFATGVTIITTHDTQGNFVGLTANAFSSVSLDPPLVMVCIDKKAESHAAVSASRVYNVNILTKEQEALSRTFAKPSDDKFAGVAYHLADNGAPILGESVAHMVCEVRDGIDAGDHTIFLAEVTELQMDHEANPLIYFRGGYRDLA